jgi:hypothetical protein
MLNGNSRNLRQNGNPKAAMAAEAGRKTLLLRRLNQLR